MDEVCGRSEGFKQFHASSSSFGRRKKQIPRQGRIINGTKAEFGVWPWQVSLRQWNSFKGKLKRSKSCRDKII